MQIDTHEVKLEIKEKSWVSQGQIALAKPNFYLTPILGRDENRLLACR